MLKTLTPLLEGAIILGGDSNTADDQGLDKSHPPAGRLTRPMKQSLRIAKLIFQHGFVDIWREINPTMRDYTHYSSPHSSFTRIDNIFIPTAAVPLASKSFIRDSIWSDHSMVFLTLQRPSGRCSHGCWRLSESILSDPIRVKEVEGTIEHCFQTNDVPDTTPSCLWAAH